MSREQQRMIRELDKKLSDELRKQKKDFNFQYAYGFIYRFEGDFVYSFILRPVSEGDNGIAVSVSSFIKPWVLNEIYWKMQNMDMDEMLAIPKSRHVNGAFAINNVFYKNRRCGYDPEDIAQSVHDILSRCDSEIEQHRKRLPSVNVLTGDVEGYSISNLTKGVAFMYLEDNEKALNVLLLEGGAKDAYNHLDRKGKSAKEYAIEFCRNRSG